MHYLFVISCLVSSCCHCSTIYMCISLSINPSIYLCIYLSIPFMYLSFYFLMLLYDTCLCRQLSMYYIFSIINFILSRQQQMLAIIAILSICLPYVNLFLSIFYSTIYPSSIHTSFFYLSSIHLTISHYVFISQFFFTSLLLYKCCLDDYSLSLVSFTSFSVHFK